MAFAVDDIVQITPADKKHPGLGRNSAGYGRVLDTSVNGVPKLYRVAIAGVPGFLYLFEEADLTAYTGPTGGLIRQLPTKKNP